MTIQATEGEFAFFTTNWFIPAIGDEVRHLENDEVRC